MGGSQFGKVFSIQTFGESHGGGVGVVIDSPPAGFSISLTQIQTFLDRRRPGQSEFATPRNEKDQVICLSGLEKEMTLGTPVCLYVQNKDAKPADYQDIDKAFRPSHADFTTDAKYGIQASSGGGRASARETIGRVAAAALAEQILLRLYPDFRCVAWIDSIKDLKCDRPNMETIQRSDIEKTPLRTPPTQNQTELEKLVLDAKARGESVGGTISCVIRGLPAGIGEPVFDKFEAELAKAMLSLPASKGFEIGSGFAGTQLFGSEHNDAFYKDSEGKVRTRTNHSGGIQGGISNGEPIYFRVAFKPVSTIFKEQDTVTRSGQEVKFKPQAGRHDPCVLPRAVPMVEAMGILVAMDLILRQAQQIGSA